MLYLGFCIIKIIFCLIMVEVMYFLFNIVVEDEGKVVEVVLEVFYILVDND